MMHRYVRARSFVFFGMLVASSAALLHCVGEEASTPVADGGAGSPDAADNDSTTGGDSAASDGGLTDTGTDAGDTSVPDGASGPRCSPDGGDGGWGTPQIVAELNDTNRNLGASLSANELTVYFATNRLNPTAPGAYGGFDVFTATRATPSGTFSGIRRVPASDPDAGDLELFANETQTGLKLFFDAYRPGRSIWVATRGSTSSDYTTSSAVTIINAGGGENGTPYVLPDESAIYFSSSRAGGLGSFDIYSAPITSGVVGAPANVGGINTSDAEQNVVVTPDNLTIYYASAQTLHGYNHDIWTATRANTSATFGSPKKLPPNVNDRTGSVTANYPTYITADTCVLYYGRLVAGVEQIWRVTRN